MHQNIAERRNPSRLLSVRVRDEAHFVPIEGEKIKSLENVAKEVMDLTSNFSTITVSINPRIMERFSIDRLSFRSHWVVTRVAISNACGATDTSKPAVKMAGDCGARVSKELAECQKDTTRSSIIFLLLIILSSDSSGSGSGITVVAQESIRHLQGTIKGPDSTPYDGGVFQIDIVIPDGYPFEPPKMKFLTKIWHPHISSQTGAICLVSRSSLYSVQ